MPTEVCPPPPNKPFHLTPPSLPPVDQAAAGERRVEVLWVDEAVRGRGIGSRLLAEAERLAREMGARNAALETFEWQAPRFYQKRGYEEVARLEGYAKGFYLALMKKAL